MHGDILTEISVLLAISAGVAMVMRMLRQPLIVGYIFTGVLVGPSLLGLLGSQETIEAFGRFGVGLLLFIVGLGLNPRVIKDVGRVSVLTGLGQVIFTSLLGFLLVRSLGYGAVTAFYVSIALAFSSTIIILKLLSDKKEQNKLYGKISIGFLLVQDLIATFALVIAAATGKGGLSYYELLTLGGRGIALGVVVVLVAKFIISPLTSFLSRSQELLFMFALAWGFGVGTVFFKLGFSLEVGALIAGITLSTMPYAQEVSSRLRPLRDFFIVVFFISLGSRLNIGDITAVIWQAVGLSVFVLVGNPIIVMIIMGLLGYTKKTSFKAGLAVAQISEFSLIFILLGQQNGQVTSEVVTLVTLVGMITIALSSYMIIYSDSLYKYMERYLGLFERRKLKHESESHHHHYEAVLIGYRKGGQEFAKVFAKLTSKYVVVDYDPDVIDELERKQIPYLYGDATDIELLDELNLEKVKLIVSTLTDFTATTFLVQHVERVNPNIVTVCAADSMKEAAELYLLGASYVILPHYIGSEKISAFIRKSGFKKSEFRHFREKQLAYLQAHFAENLEEE